MYKVVNMASKPTKFEINPISLFFCLHVFSQKVRQVTEYDSTE